jgi:ABC-type nitrate/sulfonate/bicarbonate transport system substrate-binding protein
MLKKQGIEPNNIVLVNAGDDATRYKALVAGKIDAVAASPEFEPQAPNDGVNVLARAIDIVPEWPRFIIWANPNSTKSHPDATVAFLAGMMEGLRYALQHKSEALAFVAKTLDLPATSDRIVFTYQVQAPTVSPNLDVPKDKLSAVAGFLKTLGIIDKVPDTNSMIDTSYQQKALKAIGTYKGT